MSTVCVVGSAAERYDRALLVARDFRLPAGYVLPKPTTSWPVENVDLLERYRDWLLGGGASPYTVDHIYIPTAGHALGLALKPHSQLDLQTDLKPALDYLKAKGMSAEWTDMCRNGLAKFRTFLHQGRGRVQVNFAPVNYDHYCANLPLWVTEELERYQQVQQRNWRPARLRDQTMRFWNSHTRLWRWLCERYSIDAAGDIKRRYILDYVDHQLAAGYAASSINQHLRSFRGFLLFLQDQEYQVPQALLRQPSLKQPDRLPRFLTDEQIRLLREDFERSVAESQYPVKRRDAILDRAAFYLLWQGALRLGEVEELRLEDIDLNGRKLMVRQGKGMRDRTVFLAEGAVHAVQEYLSVRGMGSTSHVFLYRNKPIHKDLLSCRIKAGGERAGVAVTPHRLRHTCATQLINAGCKVTSIQKFLGHQRLNSTMTYAKVHDRTVAEDYYSAMAEVEKRIFLPEQREALWIEPGKSERKSLLELAAQLAVPKLDNELRLDLVAQIRLLLGDSSSTNAVSPVLVSPG